VALSGLAVRARRQGAARRQRGRVGRTVKGLSEERLVALLWRRVGLMGGGRFFDLLFEGRSDTVVAAIHATA
jgi:hypothetical protein